MIVLDTNVLSELLKSQADPRVEAWADLWPPYDQFITSVTAGELLYGVRRLPHGRKRASLETLVDRVLGENFVGRILPFDLTSADHYADLLTARRRAGSPVSTTDAMIAATCLSRGASLATRNVKDFADSGVQLVDPWATA